MLIPEQVQFGIALALWVGVIVRFRLLLRTQLKPAYRSFCFGLVFALGTLTLNLPGIYAAVGTLVGVPNAAYLASLCSLAIGAFLMLPFYERLANPAHAGRPTRTSVVVLAGALVSMAASFALVRTSRNVPPFMFLEPDAPFVAEFLCVSFVALSGGFILPLIRLHWQYGRLGTTFSTRFGWGRLAPAGFVVGSASHAHALLYATSARLGLPYPLASVAIPTYYFLAFGTFTLVGLGVSLPHVGSRLGIERLYGRLRRYLLYRRLFPLWAALSQASPEIALLPPRSGVLGELGIAGDIDFYLNRRVVEIRDGVLELLPFCDARTLDAADAVCSEVAVAEAERPFIVAAAALLAAVRAKARGGLVEEAVPPPIPDADDLDREAATLAQVARYCVDARLLPRILAHLEVGSPHLSLRGPEPEGPPGSRAIRDRDGPGAAPPGHPTNEKRSPLAR